MIQYKKEIIDHPDTNIISNPLIGVSDGTIQTLTIKSASEHLDDLQHIIQLYVIADELSPSKKPAPVILDTMIDFDTTRTYEYLKQIIDDLHEIFVPMSIISPKRIEINDIGIISQDRWIKNFHSGRSFEKGIRTEDFSGSIVVKGGDLLHNDAIRSIKEGTFAPPFVGSERSDKLFKEYGLAHYIQNTAFDLYQRPSHLPIPLKINQLENYLFEKNRIRYQEMLWQTLKDKNYMHNLMRVAQQTGIDIGYPLEHPETFVTSKDAYRRLRDQYCNSKSGSHGSYTYLLAGANMRIADFLCYSEDKKKMILNESYPGLTKEQIIELFLKRIGEAFGLANGLGLIPSKIASKCILVDTTITGSMVDIGELEFNEYGHEGYFVYCQIYAELCYHFMKSVDPTIDTEKMLGFTDLFQQAYLNNFVGALIYKHNDKNLAKQVREDMKVNLGMFFTKDFFDTPQGFISQTEFPSFYK